MFIFCFVTGVSGPSKKEYKLFSSQMVSPPAGTVMVNVDAAMFNQSRRMGIGVVIRDHNGKCLAACSEHQEEVATLEIAEAVAMRRALSLAAEEGFANIIISFDCLSVVNRVSALEMDRSICGPIIHMLFVIWQVYSTVVLSNMSSVV
jgi:hypothetical protein